MALTPNFRDAGGGRLRTGLLFRSDAPDDLAAVAGQGVRLVCDLRVHRKPDPRVAPRTLRVVNVPMEEASRRVIIGCLFGRNGAKTFDAYILNYYRQMAFGETAAIHKVFTLLAETTDWPVLLHCTAGKDRTGFLVALLQSAAGVPFDLVRENYLLTNDAFAERREAFYRKLRRYTLWQVSRERMEALSMARPEPLEAVFQTIHERHGSVEAYLGEACGVGVDQLERIRRHWVAV